MSPATTTVLRDNAPREVPAPVAEVPPPADAPVRPGFMQRRSTRVFAGLTALAVVGALGAWGFGHGKESTDDAQVEGRVVSVSPRVGGQVEKVLVIDNQAVKQGDLLVQLDTKDLDAKLASARADLAAAKAGLASAQVNLKLTQANSEASLRQARGGLTQASSSVAATRSTLAQARAEVDAAEAADRLAQADWTRAQDLAKAEAISRADIDARRSRAEQAHAQLDQARARLASTEANVTSSGGGLTTAQGRLAAAETAPDQVKAADVAVQAAQARVDQAQAAYDLAALNRSYAEVRAPVDGVVSRRTVEQGQLVGPDRPMLALVPLQDVWVVANFKEDQIGQMRAGQKATIRVDTYGRRDFEGHVESLAGASGARFALLPPDNASGNFVKVVQRVPVLVRLDRAADVPLRPGMSAVVTVRTN